MRYSDNVDYLFASITYLGTHQFWWARSPQALANELNLDEHQLQLVFDSFPGIFRRSVRVNPNNGQSYYSLQARYAQKEGGDVADPDEISYITPLAPDRLKGVIDFVLRMAEQELRHDEQELKRIDQQQSRDISLRANFVAVGAAVISAMAAIAATLLRHN